MPSNPIRLVLALLLGTVAMLAPSLDGAAAAGKASAKRADVENRLFLRKASPSAQSKLGIVTTSPGNGQALAGTVIWQARRDLAAGLIDYDEFLDVASASAPSVGHCNTMGTASTMNAMAEALGMTLPGCAAIPAPYRERGQIAYETGRRAVEMLTTGLRDGSMPTSEVLPVSLVVGDSTPARHAVVDRQ